MRTFEDMTVYARFKYSKDVPAFRVHMWEIFDQANYSTKNFEDLFSAIFEKMEDIFDEEGFFVPTGLQLCQLGGYRISAAPGLR